MQPFSISATSYDDQPAETEYADTEKIPLGKLFVVEAVTGQVFPGAVGGFLQVEGWYHGVENKPCIYYPPVQANPGGRSFVLGGPTRLYVNENTSMAFFAAYDGTVSRFSIYLHGYLQPVNRKIPALVNRFIPFART